MKNRYKNIEFEWTSERIPTIRYEFGKCSKSVYIGELIIKVPKNNLPLTWKTAIYEPELVEKTDTETWFRIIGVDSDEIESIIEDLVYSSEDKENWHDITETLI